MPNTLGIRRRIRSVKNVRQITKAMELTAAAKMHRATQSVLNTRPYATRALEIARSLEERGSGTHPLLDIRPLQRELMIVVTTDRGLAGGLNNQLIRMVWQRHNKAKTEIDYVVTGKKGAAAFARLGLNLIATFTEAPNIPSLEFTRPISLVARKTFLEKTYDLVHIAYNHYQSTLTQTPTLTQLLPFKLHPDTEAVTSLEKPEEFRQSLFEPNPEMVLNSVLPHLVDHLLLQIMIESTASEHAARMMAMRNATDNAGEVLDDLQLTFNGIRQTSITAEMAEISASMTALE